jgi:hypothetical protein
MSKITGNVTNKSNNNLLGVSVKIHLKTSPIVTDSTTTNVSGYTIQTPDTAGYICFSYPNYLKDSVAFFYPDSPSTINRVLVDTVKPTVSLTSPAGSETWVATTAHNITWSATDNQAVASRALYYSIDNGSSWSLIDSGVTNTGAYTWVAPTQNSIQCKVKAMVYDPDGNTATATSPDFTIQTPAPGMPVIIAPTNKAIDIPINTMLSWTKIPTAITYDVQVSTDGFTSHNVPDTFFNLTNLATSTTYQWQVRSVNIGGSSAWCAMDTFTTIPPVPGAVTILSPVKWSTLTTDSVKITWNKATSADSFHVKLNTANAVIKDTMMADTILMVILDNNKYAVNVQGHNIAGYGTADIDSFTVDVPSTHIRNLKTCLSLTSASAKAGVINYTLASDGRVSLSIYDLQGRMVMAMDKACKAGRYSIPIAGLSPGNYIITFRAGEYSILARMMEK